MGGSGIKPFPAVFLAYSPSLWSNGNSLLSKTMLDSVNCPRRLSKIVHIRSNGDFLGVDFLREFAQMRWQRAIGADRVLNKILVFDNLLAKRTNN